MHTSEIALSRGVPVSQDTAVVERVTTKYVSWIECWAQTGAAYI